MKMTAQIARIYMAMEEYRQESMLILGQMVFGEPAGYTNCWIKKIGDMHVSEFPRAAAFRADFEQQLWRLRRDIYRRYGVRIH